MPKVPGSSNAALSANIGELVRSGWPQRQAVAIAEKWKRKAKRKKQ